MKIECVRIDGEPRRRFFLVAEVTFRDQWDENGEPDNYYSDDELKSRIEHWVYSALDDRDDGPSISFHEVPKILDVDVESIARGDYPRSGY